MNRSSTFNFEHPVLAGGFPWAFFLALAIVALVECVFRLVPPVIAIPYELGVTQFTAIRSHLDETGPTDICFVGTSRTRESVVLPEVSRRASEVIGHEVTAANYAAGGGLAGETLAITRYLLRRGKPSLIAIGVSPRLLLARPVPKDRDAMFWSFGDWRSYNVEHPSEARAILPDVVRAHLANRFYTLKYRFRPRVAVTAIVRSLLKGGEYRVSIVDAILGRASSCPVRGELTLWQAFEPDRSIVNHPVSEKHVRDFVNRLLVDGEYPLSTLQAKRLADTVRLCQHASVPIVLYEMPLCGQLTKHFPGEVVQKTHTLVSDLCEELGVPFVTLDELGVKFEDADFFESSHLNLRGASRLTTALLDNVLLPMLQAGTTQ